MFESNIHSLLLGNAAIKEEYEMAAKIGDDDFNIFSVLHLQSDALRHACFLRNLLDPNGQHGHGIKFLKLFLAYLRRDEYTDDDLAHTEVKIEEGVDCMLANSSRERRADIIIQPGGGKKIAIAHKMHVTGQPVQSAWYSERYPDSHRYRLTLTDVEVHPRRLNGRMDDRSESSKYFTDISYENHILRWLEQCQRETMGDRLLKATLTQYIGILKGLTGKSGDKHKGKAIAEMFLNQENNMKVARGIQMTLNDLEKQATEIAVQSFGKARITDELFTSRLRHEIKATLVLNDSDKHYAIYFSFYFLTPQQIGLSAYIDWDCFKWEVEINPPNYYIANIDEMYKALKKSGCRMNSSLAEIAGSMEKWIYRFIEQTEKYNIFLNQQGA